MRGMKKWKPENVLEKLFDFFRRSGGNWPPNWFWVRAGRRVRDRNSRTRGPEDPIHNCV
jgi:hypothetical protein